MGDARRIGWLPWTLWTGAAILLACEVLLAVDVARRGGAVVPYDISVSELPQQMDALGRLARLVAVNMTALCWLGYLLVADGVLVLLGRWRGDAQIASVRARPSRCVVAWLTSVPVWCFFDWVNFYLMDAWRYHGLPAELPRRLAGYFIAFAAISPGMFLAAQAYQYLGMRRLTVRQRSATRWAWGVLLGPAAIIAGSVIAILLGRGDGAAVAAGSAALLIGPALVAGVWTRCMWATSFALGAGFVGWTLLMPEPTANMTLWVGLIYLLDPVAARAGQPSLMRDWQAGRLGRTLALFAGGATCGLLWEFWNYWAVAKWTYHLPFLGAMEQWRYFEMPLVGFLGFLPFAAECWVMLNVIIAALDRLGLRVAEPLPSEDAVL